MQLNNIKFKDVQDNIVFYHHPCLDGISSAWLLSKHLTNAKYIGINHGAINEQLNLILENITEESTVIFLDFCPSKDILIELVKKVDKILIYDHHISSIRDIKGFKSENLKCFFDMNKSGVGIVCDILLGQDRTDLINIIEAIDLEKQSLLDCNHEDFYNIASYIDSIPVEDFESFCQNMNKLNKLDMIELSERGKDIRNNALVKIDKAVNNADIKIMNFLDYSDENIKFAITEGNIFEYGRELTHSFFNSFNGLDMVSVWYKDKKDVIRFHIRTKNNLDASLIAQELSKKYGINGGGHKKSAAVRFKEDMFYNFLSDCSSISKE